MKTFAHESMGHRGSGLTSICYARLEAALAMDLEVLCVLGR